MQMLGLGLKIAFYFACSHFRPPYVWHLSMKFFSSFVLFVNNAQMRIYELRITIYDLRI